MKKAHPYISKFLALVCLSSLFAVSALPSVSHAEEAEESLLMVWAPASWPKAYAYGNDSKTKSIQTCADGLDGLTEGRCGSLPFSHLNNNMSPCSVDGNVSCIKKLELQLPNENWQTATYLGPMSPSTTKWTSFTNIDLGPTSDASLFTSTSKSGIKTLWMAVAAYSFTSAEISSGTTGPSEFGISIFPIRHISASECTWETKWEALLLIAGNVQNFREYCYERLQQPSTFDARLTLTLKREPTGWVTSYLQKFDAKTTKYDDGSGRVDLTLEGSNVSFPVTSIEINKGDSERHERLCATDPEFAQICAEKFSWNITYLFRTIGSRLGRSKEKFLTFFKQFPELDRAKFETRTWSLSINMKNEDKINSCSAPKGIYGVVGGNAMVIDESVPIWNASTQTLEFGVASPHYKSDGQVARGFYEMQLNEQVAKCLWGTKVTPANVSLSVLDENGDSKVATAAISVKNGMVIFRATGFTYSSTKLSVSLKKLVCVKNGLTKTQPKGKTTCPKGWKKKQ